MRFLIRIALRIDIGCILRGDGAKCQCYSLSDNALRTQEQSPQCLKACLFPKSAEPGIGKDVAGTVGRPARRIHLAVRFHDRVVIVDFAAPLPKVTNQFLARVELRASRLVAIEVTDQTNPERDVVEIVAVHVTAVDLTPPAVTHFDLTIAGRRSVADYEMISESILHSADVPMVVIENGGVPLSRAAVVYDNVLPASTRNRGTVDCRSHRRCEISITSATAAATTTEKSRPKTARPLITVFFDRQLFRCFDRCGDCRCRRRRLRGDWHSYGMRSRRRFARRWSFSRDGRSVFCFRGRWLFPLRFGWRFLGA